MRIGAILRKWRVFSDLDYRATATQMGIGASTLLRIEKGHVPDGPTLIKLMQWMLEEETGAPKVEPVNDQTSQG